MKRSVLRAAELKLYQHCTKMLMYGLEPSCGGPRYAICPFCNKTKARRRLLASVLVDAWQAALEFLKVPYKPVEVDPLTRSQISFSKESQLERERCTPTNQWRHEDYKKVPIAVFSDGAVVGGSTQIVDKVMESEAR